MGGREYVFVDCRQSQNDNRKGHRLESRIKRHVHFVHFDVIATASSKAGVYLWQCRCAMKCQKCESEQHQRTIAEQYIHK